MKDASQFPITFAYGATDGVYYGPNGSIGPYHRGDDRAMPNGTPVIVNGVQIALSNNTGASSGSHLHIGKFINGKDVNPEGKGFSLNSPAVVNSVGYDSTNGNYIKISSGGAIWVYLHLQKILVSQGQELKGGNMPTLVDQNILEDLSVGLLGRTSKGDAALQGWIGVDMPSALRGFINYPEHKALIQRADGTLPNGHVPASYSPYSGPQLFIENK